MALLGAHMSIAGGYYKAVEAAAKCEMNVVQLFTKNNNQWYAKEITDAEAHQFHSTLARLGIEHAISHDSYLINLASPDKELWARSVDALVVELQRAERLAIPYVVAHPGAYTTGSEAAGLKAIVRALNEVHRQTRGLRVGCLLETTAGQGSSLGWRFEQLAAILDRVKNPERLGVCFDTCHVFAAGYPLGTRKEYNATIQALDAAIGIGRVKAFHLNDSKAKFGSRVDRHARIGGGEIGVAPFRHLLNDPRFRSIPMILETPKGEENGQTLDAINLRTLRSLIRRRR